MNALFIPCYFPSISQYVVMSHADEITFEIHDNFQKQTNRNRMYVYSPNGVQLLNVPVKHNSEKKHQKTKDIKVENAFDWQKQHFKSLEAAYRTSPFFEFYEDELMPIFEKKYQFLFDLNLEVFAFLNQCISLKKEIIFTEEYFHTPDNHTDYRFLAHGKKDLFENTPYHQVFEEKHGFIKNLSILDLLFNEGKYALDYLKNQKNPQI
jgi:hypothetical protein